MTGIRFASVAAVSAVVLGLSVSSAAAGTTSSAGNGHLGNSGWCEHRRLSRARPWRVGRRLVRLLQAGVHGSRRARARSGLVGVALRAEHLVARATAGRRDLPGIGRRADVLVRRYGQGLEPAQDWPGGVSWSCSSIPTPSPRTAGQPETSPSCTHPTSTRRARRSGRWRSRESRSPSRPRSTGCSRTLEERRRSSCTPSTSSTSTSGRQARARPTRSRSRTRPADRRPACSCSSARRTAR